MVHKTVLFLIVKHLPDVQENMFLYEIDALLTMGHFFLGHPLISQLQVDSLNVYPLQSPLFQLHKVFVTTLF